MRTTRRLHLLGSSALLTLTVLLAACGDETAPTSTPAVTATRAAGTVSSAGTTPAGAVTAAASVVPTGSAAATTTIVAGVATSAATTAMGAATTGAAAGSAVVATGTSAAGTATATRAAATTTGAASTGTSAALPTTAPMPATPAATSAATAASTAGTVGTVTGATTGGAAGVPAAAASPAAAAGSATAAGAVRYAIGMGSEGAYTVNEKFANLPAPNDAVGKTDQVTGQIVLGPNGQVVEGGRIVVNVQSLKSDQDRRDNYIRNTSLESSKFPEATFVIRSAEGLMGPLGASPTDFRITGDLTLHGVTRPVTWNATASQSGDTINGTATLTVKMQDFMITPPMIAILTTSDMAKLDLKIVARRMA